MTQQVLPSLTSERRRAIAGIVAQAGFAHVTDLASRFQKDGSTIRRDLEALEEQGRVRRVHGGAVALGTVSRPAAAAIDDQEARIGTAVAAMIADGETVALGPGRLPLEVARRLAAKTDLTVVTYGLEVAYWIATHTSHGLILAGGQVAGRDLALVGQLTRAALASLRASRVVLEAGGVSALGGLTEDDLPQAEIARVLLETGSEIIVVVPPERVGRVAAAYVAPVSDVDVIVTAREAGSPFLWDLSEMGVRIVLA